MAGNSKISTTIQNPAKGKLLILHFFESTYALIALDEQTIEELHFAERIFADTHVGHGILRQHDGDLSITSKNSLGKVVGDAVHGLRKLAQSLQPAQLQPQFDLAMALQSTAFWILEPGNREVATALRNLSILGASLTAWITACQALSTTHPALIIPSNARHKVNQAIVMAAPNRQEQSDGMLISDPGQLLHYRRIVRNRHRSTNSLPSSGIGLVANTSRVNVTAGPSSPIRTKPHTHELHDGSQSPSQNPPPGRPWHPSLTSTAELEGSIPQPGSGNMDRADLSSLAETSNRSSLAHQSGRSSATPTSARDLELPHEILNHVPALSLSLSSSSAGSDSTGLRSRPFSNPSVCARRPVGAPRELKPSESSVTRYSDGCLIAKFHSSHASMSRRNGGYGGLFQPLELDNSSAEILNLYQTLSGPSIRDTDRQLESINGMQPCSHSDHASQAPGFHQTLLAPLIRDTNQHQENANVMQPSSQPDRASQSPHLYPLPPVARDGPISHRKAFTITLPSDLEPLQTGFAGLMLKSNPPTTQHSDNPLTQSPLHGTRMRPTTSLSPGIDVIQSGPESVSKVLETSHESPYSTVGSHARRKRSSWLYRQAARASAMDGVHGWPSQ